MLLHADLHLQLFRSPEGITSLDAEEAFPRLERAAHSGILALRKDLPPGSSYDTVPLFLIEPIIGRLTASLLSDCFLCCSPLSWSSLLRLCRGLASLQSQAQKSTSTLLRKTWNLFPAGAKARRLLSGPFSQDSSEEIPGLPLRRLQSVKLEIPFPHFDRLNEARSGELVLPSFMFCSC